MYCIYSTGLKAQAALVQGGSSSLCLALRGDTFHAFAPKIGGLAELACRWNMDDDAVTKYADMQDAGTGFGTIGFVRDVSAGNADPHGPSHSRAMQLDPRPLVPILDGRSPKVSLLLQDYGMVVAKRPRSRSRQAICCCRHGTSLTPHCKASSRSWASLHLRKTENQTWKLS